VSKFVTIGYGDQACRCRAIPRGAGVQIEFGPFMRSQVPVGGFAIIEEGPFTSVVMGDPTTRATHVAKRRPCRYR
jgi:hypothetical protein